jgi:beta-1,4-N-acetylglucosaminyltransferase
MIFSTVGTHNQGFERLIKKLDEIAPKIDDEVIMQIGSTRYKPKNARWFEFSEYEELLRFIQKADVIICHGGAGTLLDCLKFNKKIVIVPRLEKFGEVYDNHELELAEALENKGQVKVVYEIEDLERSLGEVKIKQEIKKGKELSKFLKSYLNY